MRHLDLFSGIGGFSLAAQWVWGEEYENVGMVEIDAYCQKVLKLRFPKARIYRDIRKEMMPSEALEQATRIDLVTGGFQ